jgi:hypothetical protein
MPKPGHGLMMKCRAMANSVWRLFEELRIGQLIRIKLKEWRKIVEE